MTHQLDSSYNLTPRINNYPSYSPPASDLPSPIHVQPAKRARESEPAAEGASAKFIRESENEMRILGWINYVGNVTQFPSNFFDKILEINRSLCRKEISQLAIEDWQVQRDAFLSKELAASSDVREMRNKLGRIATHNPQEKDFQIKELNLEGFKHGCPSSFFQQLGKIHGLVSLKLFGLRSITQESGDFTLFSSLRSLSVTDCRLGDWKALNLPEDLVALTIRNATYLSEDAFQAWRLRNLKILILDRCPLLGGQSLKAISKNFTTLVDLVIREAHVTHRTDLSPLRRLPKLRSLMFTTEHHPAFQLTLSQLKQLNRPNAVNTSKLENLTVGFFSDINVPLTNANEEITRDLPALRVHLLPYKPQFVALPVWSLPKLHMLLQNAEGSLLIKPDYGIGEKRA